MSTCLDFYTEAKEIQQKNGKEITVTKKYSVQCKEIHLVTGCPPGSRGCDALFQLPPHMHDRGKHRKNHKTLPFKNLFGCQYVKVVLTKKITFELQNLSHKI